MSEAARHIGKPGLERHTLVFHLTSRKRTSLIKVLIVGKNNWAISYKRWWKEETEGGQVGVVSEGEKMAPEVAINIRHVER